MTSNPVFIPGPSNIPERLRRAIDIETRDHRSPDFPALIGPVLDDLRTVFRTERGQVLLFPSTGTGGWEAALSNTLSPGDRVLLGRYGTFSQKWAEMCRQHGLDVEIVDAPWGAGAPAAAFETILAADRTHSIKAVLVTHNETATGVVSDIAAVRRALDDAAHPALLLVDCVSSLASMPFEMDAWGIDVAITASQKGFMLPTGLAILAMSPKAIVAMQAAGLPRSFFDFTAMLASNHSGGFPYTPPVPLIVGLRESLAMLSEEGLERVFARHARIAGGVRAAVAAWGMSLCARQPQLYSDTVSTVLLPPGADGRALIDHVYRAYGVSFGVGLGELDGRAFRIGHLGMLTDVAMLGGLAAIEMAMADVGIPVPLGAGVAAAQDHYRMTRGTALKIAA